MTNYHEEGDRKLLADLRRGRTADLVAAIDKEAILASAIATANALREEPSPETTEPSVYLNWAADHALRLFDRGEAAAARQLFSYLLRRHSALAHLYNSPELLGDSIASTKNGREAFEGHMRGLLAQH